MAPTQNLRSSLDYLAQSLVLAAGNSPTSVTCFPIAASAEKYKSDHFRRKVKGMRQEAVDAIDAIKPYRGGNDALWQLHQLNNIDKHRFLLTGGTKYFAHTMTPIQREKAIEGFHASRPNDTPGDLRGVLTHPIGGARMLRAGDVLLTTPESEVEPYMQFRFDVAFAEPGILEGAPIVETLHHMKQVVAKIVLSFDGLC